MGAPRWHDGRGRLSAYAFGCGAVERFGGVALWREHGVYHVARHPDAPGGWKRDGSRYLGRARHLAAALRRESRALSAAGLRARARRRAEHARSMRAREAAATAAGDVLDAYRARLAAERAEAEAAALRERARTAPAAAE